MAPEHLNILHTAFNTAKLKGLHNNITPAPKSFASELVGLLSRKTKLEMKNHGKKIKDSHSRALPNHVHTALQKWAARLHLCKHNPTWLQNLACDIPEANWHLNNDASHPICYARHAETAPGLKKIKKQHSDKMQTTRCSHRPALGDVAPPSNHSRMGLSLIDS